VESRREDEGEVSYVGVHKYYIGIRVRIIRVDGVNVVQNVWCREISDR